MTDPTEADRAKARELVKPHMWENVALENAIAAALAGERERCAKIAEGISSAPLGTLTHAQAIAAAIRRSGDDHA